jgi:hypothetical protein
MKLNQIFDDTVIPYILLIYFGFLWDVFNKEQMNICYLMALLLAQM